MEAKEIKLKSKCDNLPISVMTFIPEGEIKGIFQIAHGMCEHKERYYNFMEYLTNQGYITIINDHRGHGESVKNKDDLGYFYDDTGDYIVEDLHQVTEYIKEMYPDKEVTLLGHSMGSMVVRKYIKKYDNEIKNLIVCGSPSKNELIDLGLILVEVKKFFQGERHRSNLLQRLALKKNNQKFKDAKSDNSWICSDKRTVEVYDHNDLCGFTFTINGFKNLFKLMKHIYSRKGWSLNNKDLPIFFIAGKDDPIIGNEDKWTKSQEFLKEVGYRNVTGKLYEGLRHEILNEKNNEEIYNDILKFIN